MQTLGELGVSLPTSEENVKNTVEQLKEKLAYFKENQDRVTKEVISSVPRYHSPYSLFHLFVLCVLLGFHRLSVKSFVVHMGLVLMAEHRKSKERQRRLRTKSNGNIHRKERSRPLRKTQRQPPQQQPRHQQRHSHTQRQSQRQRPQGQESQWPCALSRRTQGRKRRR